VIPCLNVARLVDGVQLGGRLQVGVVVRRGVDGAAAHARAVAFLFLLGRRGGSLGGGSLSGGSLSGGRGSDSSGRGSGSGVSTHSSRAGVGRLLLVLHLRRRLCRDAFRV